MPNGILIIPSISDRNIRGTFDLEVYCSEAITLNQLSDSTSRVVAGAWIEGQAGGSHLVPATWKKNPKFNFNLKSTNRLEARNPCKLRITLSRSGQHWRSICKKNSLGAMIGFYIFISRGGELSQIYESTFVPTDQLSTEANFSLSPLFGEDEYVIMPTTYSENILGSFVLSVISDHEFTLRKEK